MTIADQEIAIDSLLEQLKKKEIDKMIQDNLHTSQRKEYKQSEKIAWRFAGFLFAAVIYLMFKGIVS